MPRSLLPTVRRVVRASARWLVRPPVGAGLRAGLCTLALLAAASGRCQVPVTPEPDHERLLAAASPTLAANKRLVYDFWREVLEGGQLQLADQYLADDYIQHNPTVPTGRAGFVSFFGRFSKPVPVQPRVKAPLVTILAEGNLVMLAFVSTQPDPADPAKTYTTTWFDLFRVESGRIAEHWDPATRR